MLSCIVEAGYNEDGREGHYKWNGRAGPQYCSRPVTQHLLHLRMAVKRQVRLNSWHLHVDCVQT